MLLRFLVVVFVGMLVVPTSNAASLVTSGGTLLGASGVDVGGTLYDVSFQSGSCTGLLGGCNEASDFTFGTQAEATTAAQALLDDVFSTTFANSPENVNGCSSTTRCNIRVYFALIPPGNTEAQFMRAGVEGSSANVVRGPLDRPIAGGTTGATETVALFTVTPVPVPAAALLMPSGLALVGFVMRRRRRGSHWRCL